MNAVMELFAGAVRDDRLRAAVRKNHRAVHAMIAGALEGEKVAGRLPGDLDTDLAAKIAVSVALGIKMERRQGSAGTRQNKRGEGEPGSYLKTSTAVEITSLSVPLATR